MEGEFDPQHREYIEELAKKLINTTELYRERVIFKLVNGKEMRAEREIVREIIHSGFPVCVEFYRKYVRLMNDYGHLDAGHELSNYFYDIASNTNPDFSGEIYESICEVNDFEIDKSVAANPNPRISVKLLRKIASKEYEQINKGYVTNQVANLKYNSRKTLLAFTELMSGYEILELREKTLKLAMMDGIRPSLKWIVKENILKRQQLLLKKFTDIFDGKIDPIYQKLDKYDVLETCDDLATILYPQNNSTGEITANRRFEETAMDIINPGNKDGIPNLLAQIEVYINGLNVAQKRLFGRPKLLKLCNILVQKDSISLLKSDLEDCDYLLKSICFNCTSQNFDGSWNRSLFDWETFQQYVKESTNKDKVANNMIQSSNVGITNYSFKDPIGWNLSDLSYDNPDSRSDTMDRILLLLQKDRNFIRKLLEELLKEPLPNTEQILFAENTELEAKKLSEPSKQEEIWYIDMEKKIFQEELTIDSKQEEIECRNLVEKLKYNPLDYFWKQSCVDIDKLFAGNKRILILLNPDLKNEEGWVRPNWQLRGCWEGLKSKYESKSQEEIDYTKYSFVANQLLLRLSRNYETILNELKLDNKELAGLLNLEITKITKVVESLKIIFVD